MEKLLNFTAFSNSGREYLLALIVFIFAYFLLRLIKKILIRRARLFAKRSINEIDDIAVDILAGIKPLFYLISALYIGLRMLS